MVKNAILKSFEISKRKASAYLVIIVFATVLAILATMLVKMQRGYHALLSKTVRDYLAQITAETALNYIIAELNFDQGFRTSRYCRKIGNRFEWKTPLTKRSSNYDSIEDIKIYGVSNGVYSGKTGWGQFKAKVAPCYGAKENSITPALREKEIFFYVEIVSKVGDEKSADSTSYRRVKAFLERRSPITEHTVYDGEVLDFGSYGPYLKFPNKFKGGRYYGQNYILFNKISNDDLSSEFLEIEKLETPGFIRSLKPTKINCINKKSILLDSSNDSLNPIKFQTCDGILLDGNHEARNIKFVSLPLQRLYEKALKPRKYGSLIIDKNTLPVSKYKNPYDPKTEYYDLDFGEYKCGEDETDDLEDDMASESEIDDDSDEDNTLPPADTDDPGPLSKVKGKKVLIYSKVPLRIWGCPDRSITIVCEKDVVICGDFNQNPNTPQDYPDDSYYDYNTKLKNGKNYHKVGALIMTNGRIFIDISYPSLFLANEAKPVFLYYLAKALHPSTPEIEKETKIALCPLDPRQRRDLVGLGPPDANGIPTPRYGTIAWLYNNPYIDAGPVYEVNISDLVDFFTPSPDTTKPRFGIRDSLVRNQIIDLIKQSCRNDGVLSVLEMEKIWDLAIKQAKKEELQEPDMKCGVMSLAQYIYKEAIQDLKDGIFLPEITINAYLVSSVRRSATFAVGNAGPKVLEEVGNAVNCENVKIYNYLKPPAIIIQRVYGSEIRLASSEPSYFVDGKFSPPPTTFIRRRILDIKTPKSSKFKPPEIPYVTNILTYTEESINAIEYQNF